MEPLFSAAIYTPEGDKNISVFAADILNFDRDVDVLTVSAYYGSYNPTPGTMMAALFRSGISVARLSCDPLIDLRSLCNVWLSREVGATALQVGRIGCVEMIRFSGDGLQVPNTKATEQAMLNSIKAYFQMLDIAATYGIKMDTIAMPLLGAGKQHISEDLILLPIINECIQFLKRNSLVKRIYFVERDPGKAFRMAQTLAGSYAVSGQQVTAPPKARTAPSDAVAFISYSSPDRNIADNLCAKLEARGIKVWYAPRNVHKDYASAITEAIYSATHFVVILSKNSMSSQHVLNEIDLAFKRLPNHIRFKPLRIDEQEFAPAFDYYLSRQHWMDAHLPPLEQRLTEFADSFLENT